MVIRSPCEASYNPHALRLGFIYHIEGNFRRSKFSQKSIYPLEEIFAVLIFAFRPRPFIAAGLTEHKICPVGKGRTLYVGLK